MTKELDAPKDLVRLLAEQSDARFRKQNPPPGGSKNVDFSIGGDDCWCGRPSNHDWPGKEDRAPHPKYPD